MKKHLPAIACLGLFVSWFFINEVIKVFRYTNFQLLISYIIAYTIAAGAVYALLYAFTRQVNKSWWLTQLVLFFLLLFGFVKDSLSAIIPFFNRYAVFIPFWLLIGTIVFFLFYRSKNDFRKLRNYFTIILLAFVAMAIFDVIRQPQYDHKLENVFTTKPQAENLPNLYIFIFDEYSRLDRLEELGYSPTAFKNQLQEKNIRLVPQTYSYTDLTSVCVPSILNATNPDFSKFPASVSNHELYLLWNEYKQNNLHHYLKDLGYKSSLYGIMPMSDLDHQTAMNFHDFLMVDLLRQNTFLGRTNMQVGNSIAKAGIPFMSRWFYNILHKPVHETYLNDSINLEKLKSNLQTPSNGQPEVVIAHFLFPHSPYVRDADGNYQAETNLLSDDQNNDLKYIEQVKYTEKVIMELATLIQQKEAHSVALFLGDHGYREHSDSSFNYQNFLAFYDSRNELSFHDSITYVNLMRNILNEKFNFELPQLEDSVQLIFRNKNKQ